MNSTKAIQVLLIFTISILFGTCTSKAEDNEIGSKGKLRFTSLNLQFDFLYPNDWHVFELSEEIKLATSRELLTYPPDEITILDEQSFLASLYLTDINELRTLYLQLSSLLNSAASRVQSIEDTTIGDFFSLDKRHENSLEKSNEIFEVNFDFKIDLETKFLYFVDNDLIVVKNNQKSTIIVLGSLFDNQYIGVLRTTYLMDTITIDSIQKSVELVLSVTPLVN